MKTNQATLTYELAPGLTINRLAYGAMQLNGEGVFGPVKDKEAAISLLQEVVNSGVNFIDTAYAYGPELNESLIAEALHPYANGLVIATKGGATLSGPNQWVVNGDPEFINNNIETSLKRLKTDSIALWQLHRIDPNFPVEETLAPVVDAVKAGKIKHVGLSEAGIADIERIRKIIPVVSVQNLYNLGDRHWEEVVQYTGDNEIAFIPWYPLASGPNSLNEKVAAIALRHEATTSQIALAWLLKRWPHTILIPGTKSSRHFQENIRAANIQLTEAEIHELSF